MFQKKTKILMISYIIIKFLLPQCLFCLVWKEFEARHHVLRTKKFFFFFLFPSFSFFFLSIHNSATISHNCSLLLSLHYLGMLYFSMLELLWCLNIHIYIYIAFLISKVPSSTWWKAKNSKILYNWNQEIWNNN